MITVRLPDFGIGLLPADDTPSTDVLRTSARALKYSADNGVPRPADPSIPLTYATPNKPTQGEVTGS